MIYSSETKISMFYVCNVKIERSDLRASRRVSSPLKSTSPFPSVSKMSMTRCTSGFCCSSGRDMNSSTLSEPELSRSSFLNRFPSLLISSASTRRRGKRKHRQKVCVRSCEDIQHRVPRHLQNTQTRSPAKTKMMTKRRQRLSAADPKTKLENP